MMIRKWHSRLRITELNNSAVAMSPRSVVASLYMAIDHNNSVVSSTIPNMHNVTRLSFGRVPGNR